MLHVERLSLSDDSGCIIKFNPSHSCRCKGVAVSHAMPLAHIKDRFLRSHSPTIALLLLTTMSDLPPLPRIDGDVDLMLDVYTHSSLRFGGAPMNDDYGDTERLAELGAKVLELTVTNQLFLQRPFLHSKEIQVRLVAIPRFSVICECCGSILGETFFNNLGCESGKLAQGIRTQGEASCRPQ